MAIIVEDGTARVDSETYVSTAEADTYFTSIGNGSWALLTTTEKEQALRRATNFMLGRYRSRWKGARVNFHQSLCWPRQGVTLEENASGPGYYGAYIAYNVIPREVKYACAELALRAAAGPLLEDQEQKIIQETIGPITTKYDPNGPALIKYSNVDEMLSVYLGRGGSSAMVKLSRV